MMEKDEIFKMALDVWGFEIQSLVLIEEMSELTKEIIKYHRRIHFKQGSILPESFLEELADTQIMMEQIKFSLSPNQSVIYSVLYQEKLKRAQEWLTGETL